MLVVGVFCSSYDDGMRACVPDDAGELLSSISTLNGEIAVATLD
jgi:hypothetical protein